MNSINNISIVNDDKEEIKYKEITCVKSELSVINGMKPILSENQLSKYENFDYSQPGSPKLPKFEQDILSMENKDFMLESHDSEIDFSGKDLFVSYF